MSTKKATSSHDEDILLPPPWLGKVGAVAFFATLFRLAHPNLEGYHEFRKCHSNCGNGLLHFIGMPLAVSGVFLIVRGVANDAVFARHISFIVTTIYFALYLQYEENPYSPWLFYVMYMSIWEFALYRHLYQWQWSRISFIGIGIALIAFNVGALEVIGHGFYEHHHSYISEFFNSVFHTPLYGVNSVMTMFEPREDHTCWW